MLLALKEIGDLLLEKEAKNVVDILLENPDTGNYKTVFVINFDSDFNFVNVTQEEFKSENWRLYLYRKGSGNGTDFSPTSRWINIERTFNNRFMRWFRLHSKDNSINKMYNQMNINKDVILEKLEFLDKQDKNNKIITVKINDKYIYQVENPDFRKIFLDEYIQKLEEISGEDAFCSICGKHKKKVFTTPEIYKFYNMDKPGYIAGGFNKKNAWKNFPICNDCFLKIDYARKHIEANLEFNFYGKTYYIIPNVILNTQEALDDANGILTDLNKKITLSKGDRFTDDEREIFYILKEYKDFISFYILFLEKDNNARYILLLIEDVLPSTLRKMFVAKKKIDSLFEDISSKKYDFSMLNEFLNKYDKIFIEVRGAKLIF